MQFTTAMLPFVPGESVELGAGATGMQGRASFDLTIPIFDRTAFGFAPLLIALDCAEASLPRCVADVRVQPFRVSLFVGRGVWLDAAAPTYSWIDCAWRLDPSLTIGWAWDVSTAIAPRREVARFGRGGWLLPDVTQATLRRSRSSRELFLQTSVVSSRDDELVGAGVALRWDHDRWDKRSGLAPGFDVAIARGASGGRALTTLGVAATLRVYLARSFALTASPLAGVFGQRAGAMAEAAQLAWDVGGTIGVAAIVGSMAPSIDSPRLSYRGADTPHQLTVRLGWLF